MATGRTWALLSMGVLMLSWSASAAPIASGDLILYANDFFSSAGPPDTYHLGGSGDFKGFFYAPFAPSDLAFDGAGGVLFGSNSSNLLVKTDTRGGLLDLIATPVPRIDGVGRLGDGSLIVSSGNLLYELDERGGFRDLIFAPVAIGALGVDPLDRVVFLSPGDFFSSFSISFLDLADRSITSFPTTLTSASGIDVSESGEILVAGSKNFSFGSQSVFRFDLSGNELGVILGPANVSAVAIANLPEPSTAVLLGGALAALGGARRRS